MLDHLFESLENRSLLSHATFLTGAPIDAEHERQVIEALENLGDGGNGELGDADMYRFVSATDDAVYDVSEDDTGTVGESYGILAPDVFSIDSGWNGAAAEESGTQEWAARDEAPGSPDASALAIAIQNAHNAVTIQPPKLGDNDSPRESKHGGAKSVAPVQIRFHF